MIRTAGLISLLSVTPAVAETVRVRTGDHADFTRVVIDIAPIPDWTAGRTQTGYAIAIDGVETFDLSSAFRIIGRDRIAEFIQEGRRLDLTLACDCHARFYEIDDRRLVIDVRDGAPGQTARHEKPFADGPEVQSDTPRVQSDMTPVFGAIHVSGDQPVVTPIPDPSLSRETPADMNASFTPASSEPFAPFETTSESLNGLDLHLDTAQQQGRAVQILSNELARAVSQGLVDVDETPEDSAIAESLSEAPANVNISTSVDRAFQARTDGQEASAFGGMCIADAELDIATWSSGDMLSEIGAKRSAAYGEDGRITEPGAIDLAKYYIASGFGAEARAVLRSVDVGATHDLLLGLAEIVDHGQSDRPVFAGQSSCKGRIALWSILALGLPMGERPTDRSHILRAFSELAPHLRSLLGPKLADHLRAVRLEEDALVVLNAARRAGNSSDRHSLTAARLDLNGTSADTARQELVALANGSGTIAAAALHELLEDAERRGVAPQVSWVEDAADLARATIGTPISKELSLAGLRARLVIGQFEEFRDLVARGQPGLGAEEVGPLSVAAIATAAKTADDALFIRTETAFSKVVTPDDMDREERFVVADRLLQLGLLRKAATYLPSGPETADERRIYASIRAAREDEDFGIGVLAFRGEVELQELLARVHLADANVDGALAALERADKSAEAVEVALGAGRFDWVADHAEARVSEPTRTLLSDRELIGIEPPSNGPLLAQSTAFRDSISELLEAVPLPQ